MCGIIGVLGVADAAPLLVDGLRRLEYRGYDSAGVATLVGNGIERRRSEGRIERLAALLDSEPLAGSTGIGHTSWATHGPPSTANTHPHTDGRVVVVHNGIIENFQELRDELGAAGRRFDSDTDTEAVVHLVGSHLDAGLAPADAVAAALPRLRGAFALAMLFAGHDGLMIAARRGSPLAIGYGDGEMYVGSDALALSPLADRICYLEEGDWAEITAGGAAVRDESGAPVVREIRPTPDLHADAGKGNFPHYMLKEIFEQPAVIGDTLQGVVNPLDGAVALPRFPFDPAEVPRISIVACGTSLHAGMVARYWLEEIAGIPADVEIASEFRHRDARMTPGGAALFISQSGETADTLAALRHARAKGQRVLSVVNVPESSMHRESDAVLLTRAGPEIGVASTKAFTTQLTTLAALVIAMAAARGEIDDRARAELGHALAEVPARANDVLVHDESIAGIARPIRDATGALYLGRGTGYPIALEGALKLKEISYLHAEGYAAGEMKHGPIALIDDRMPVIVIAPSDRLFDKTASNMQEVAARGGRVVLLSDANGIARLGDMAEASVELPAVDPFVAPILYAIPVQLLAYHVAVLKGADVDRPRNLAKSVTVE